MMLAALKRRQLIAAHLILVGLTAIGPAFFASGCAHARKSSSVDLGNSDHDNPKTKKPHKKHKKPVKKDKKAEPKPPVDNSLPSGAENM